jgi:hypothetical protein
LSDTPSGVRALPTHASGPRGRWPVLVLLAVAAVIGSLQIHWHTFLDESENLYFGYRMSQGDVLYVDMFSHHFPFPYWWVALTTYAFGKSIVAVRLSLVAFEVAAFAAAAWVGAVPIAVGMAAVLWSLVGWLYYGNLLIAYSFKALALMVVAAGVPFGASDDAAHDGKHLLIGVFGAVAMLTDPTAVYIVGAMVLLLWARGGWRAAAAMALPGAVGVLGMVAWLHATGSWDAFMDYALRYNRDVYAVFGRAHASGLRAAVPYDGVFWNAVTALRVLDDRWWAVVPATPLSWPGALHDRWVLTGLAYRVYVIVLTLLLVLGGDRRRALGLYGFAVLALALRGQEGFHASTFALASLLSAGVVVTAELSALAQWRGSGTVRAVRGVVATGLVVLAACGASVLWRERAALAYEANFGRYEDLGRTIEARTCRDPGVRVSHWPSDLLVNWFADRLPLSKFTYVLPWTIDLGRDDLLAALRRERAVVTVDLDGTVGPYANADYLGELLTAMEDRFAQVERGVFLSRDLLACQRGAGGQ